MTRTFTCPRDLLSIKNSTIECKHKLFYAYSDLNEQYALEWRMLEHGSLCDSWEELQYDLETGRGACTYPRDMLYGFAYLDQTPFFKDGKVVEAMQRMTSHKFGQAMLIPPLQSLRKLKRGDFLKDGMWIILVRCPRPIGSRAPMPMSRRKDILKLQMELDMHPSNVRAQQALQDLRTRAESEIHPTEAQLYQTKAGCLVQAVMPNIVCARCGAKGHHLAHTHDDVTMQSVSYSQTSSVQTFPAWMNVLPMPTEQLQNVPVVEEGKGFELHVRQTSAQIPLRLARRLKLQGAAVMGDVYATGVFE